MHPPSKNADAFHWGSSAYNVQAKAHGILFSMSNRELWQNALVQIELGTSEASFRTWFRNTDIAGRDAGTVQVAVPSKIVKEWLMEKHNKLILKALRSLDTTVRTVEYVVHRATTTEIRKPGRVQAPENAA